MQNMWVRDPERVKAMIERDGERLRLALIERFLFAGCLTGRRLKAAFGADVCGEIVWEESTREIAGDPKTIFPPDHMHMVDCIKTYKPNVILTFGVIARDALHYVESNHGSLFAEVVAIASPHPAARQPDTIAKLKRAAEDLRAALRKDEP